MNSEKENFINDILQESNVKSFAPIWTKVQRDNPLGIKPKELREYLSSLESAQIHKKNTVMNSFTPHYPLQEFQIDIAYIKGCNYEDPSTGGMVINQLKDPDNNRIYALTCIDVFTKFAWLVIMKKRDAKTSLNALLKIIKKMGKPEMIYCDDGTEFKNSILQTYCNANDIELIFNISHAPFIERFHRTLKERLNAYFEDTGSKTLTPDVLFGKSGIITEYNKEIDHSTTKMPPVDAMQEKKKETVRRNIVDRSKYRQREAIVKGDQVRVLLKTKSTQKGFVPKYSKSIYTVEKKEGRYYYLSGDPPRDKYMRHMLMKVVGGTDVKVVKKEAKDEGTKARFMKDLAKAEITEESKVEAEKIKQQAKKDIAEKIASIKGRVRKKNPKFAD